MKCFRCQGVIPDVIFDGTDRFDCKNHKKSPVYFDFEEYRKFRTN